MALTPLSWVAQNANVVLSPHKDTTEQTRVPDRFEFAIVLFTRTLGQGIVTRDVACNSRNVAIPAQTLSTDDCFYISCCKEKGISFGTQLAGINMRTPKTVKK